MSEINAIVATIGELKNSIESGYATKTELQKHADAVQALSKQMDQKRLAEKTDPIFGSKAAAVEFIDCMKSAIARSNKVLEKNSPFFMNKSDLDSTTTSGGVEYVPTGTSSVLSYLLEQGGLNRRECTVIPGIVGDLVMPKRTAASTAMVFTAADDTSLTDDGPTTGKVTLSPKQISGMSLVSDKLLYVSAVNIAELVALDLTEQAAKLEDEALVRGDASAAYGLVTGLNGTTTGGNSVAAGSFSIDNVLQLTAEVAEEVQGVGNGKFYMHGVTLAALRKKKGSTNDHYIFDPTVGAFTIAGYPIVVWNRLDSTIANTKFPVYFGDMKKAVVVGTGRDIALAVDHSFKFGSNQTAFKLTYDWQAQVIQATALAKVTVTA